MMDSVLKALQVMFAVVSISCAVYFCFRVGYRKGYLDGRLSLQTELDGLKQRQDVINETFKRFELRFDSVNKAMKEE